MSRFKLIIAAIIALLAIVVVIQNTQTVETKLLFVTVSMPRALLLLVTLLVGFVLGILWTGRMAGTRPTAKGEQHG